MKNIKNTELYQKLDCALDKIRPYLQADGGDIALIEITDDLIVKVEFLGACKTCFLNNQTFYNGVEETIRKVMPEVKAVELVGVE